MNAILKEFPSFFTTKRLLIRAAQPGDGAILRSAVIESQEALREWMPWAVEIQDEEMYEAMVREWHLSYMGRKELPMLLFKKESGMLVGASGLHRIDWEVPKVEIGYWVRTSLSGNGYITESTAGITAFAFEQLGVERIEIRCDSDNDRSAAIPRRLGFLHEGTLRAESRHHLTNELRDTMIFAKVRQNIQAQ